MDYTRTLAEFCSGITLESLPEEVVEKAKLCVLDFIANVYGSCKLEAVRGVVDRFRRVAGPGEAPVLACGFSTTVRDAAFLNGTMAEAIEAQDGLRFGGNHPVSAVMPAAFAVAQERGRSGRELIEAVVAGYEMANRVAASVHPFHTFSGFLPTGTCGTFGAAAAAARLRGLDAPGMLNALGVAGYLVPLSMAEQLMGGCTVKIVQGGQAAHAGITAVDLAEAGLSGHPRVLEGSELKGGFTQITVKAEPVCERLTEGLGERYTISDVYFKPYTACRHTHGAAQATCALVDELGLRADQVDSIVIHTYGIATVAVGKGLGENPTFVAAQFSVPFVVAACLLEGRMGPDQLTDEFISRTDVADLMGRTTVVMDEELNAVYPEKTSSRVEVTLKDGTVLSRQVDIPRGDPRDPMRLEDIAGKLEAFAGERGKELNRVVELVEDLQSVDDIALLTSLI
ncbi:MAG: MmgE/PrpD family protein [Actinobacteria bacterium]|nr:MmgE/PrpD family protein [Actinomycetota bacterium]MBU1944910.1 MmgE/PrpD family protein [Actinomycetota bacterium]MBU2688114.1 MmgE/PrpD family protein [Actinomycetota bacterium]